MNRNSLLSGRASGQASWLSLVVGVCALLFGPSAALAQGDEMTFEPDDLGKPAAKPATKNKKSATKGKGAKKGEMTFEPAAVEQSLPPSKTLQRALKLYDQEDYYSTTIELNKVVEGTTGDDTSNRQRAEFFMGKALFQMRFYSAALSFFDRIVQTGPGHRYYGKTLQWLASLSQFLPESAGVLEKIGKYTREDLDQPALEPVRDQLYFLLGRFHYTTSAFEQALELLRAVPYESEYFARSKFLEGMTHIRQYKAKPASAAFKEILRKSIEDPDPITLEFQELAYLSMARTFYALGQFPLSVKYYNKIEHESGEWLPSLFESSWAHFQMKGDSKALGNIHTINAPYFENEFYPESLILKAVIYFQRCNYKRAMSAVKEFEETYPGLKRDLDAIIAKYPDNMDFYTYVLNIRDGDSGLPDRVQRAAEGAISDVTMQKSLTYVEELERELAQIEESDPAWKTTAVAGNILQDLTLQKSLAANEAAQMARDRLKRLSNEIQKLVKDSIKIEYETLNAQKGVLAAAIKQEQAESAGDASRKDKGKIKVDDEHHKWPFTGEYWKDELGAYRFKVVNLCNK